MEAVTAPFPIAVENRPIERFDRQSLSEIAIYCQVTKLRRDRTARLYFRKAER
jgi:hypothetical protein